MLDKIISLLRRNNSGKGGKYSLYIAAGSVHLLVSNGKSAVRTTVFEYQGDQVGAALTQALAQIPKNQKVELVLASAFYQLVQLDKPLLTDAELMQALPWQIKDLVTIAPEDMVADYIDLPAQAAQQAKISVVVAKLSWLKQLVKLIADAGLKLVSIQPEEWLARYLLVPARQPCMLIIHQPDQEVLLQIIQDDVLYFSRRTRGFTALHQADLATWQDGLFDRLLLELQRSMDYFESQLKQAPVRDVRVLMQGGETLCQLLNDSGFIKASILTPPRPVDLPSSKQVQCWPALALLCHEGIA